jgi:OOP family OmpA-OmpF porin
MQQTQNARVQGRFRPSHVLAMIAAALVLAGCAASVPAPQAEPEPEVTAPEPVVVQEPTPEPEPQPEVVLTSPVGAKQVETATVFFDFDKSELKPEAVATLDALAEKAQGRTVEVTIVIGHTDSIGTAEYNIKLSVRRADAVKAHLTSKGINPASVFTEGKGLTAPARPNDTAEGRAMNRRADIELVIVQ